ncbi:hypothetical protein BDQ17DRAFT_1329324 [Cyathus striatus]|nr:hypothetical protein BDQ17DRAFT_1329324 [Cyathus striatus]
MNMDTLNAQPTVFLRNSSCLAALMVQVLDHASTFQFECECIWRYVQVIMLRVYALYQKDFKVGMLLAILLVGGDCACVIWVIAEELIILTLTLAKVNIATQYIHIVGRVIRDGGGFFALAVAAHCKAAAIPLVLPSVKDIRATFATFSLVFMITRSWDLTIQPIVACRLIKGFLEVDTETYVNHSRESSS